MMRTPRPLALIAVVLFATVATGCGSPPPSASPTPTATQVPTPTTTPTTTPAAAAPSRPPATVPPTQALVEFLLGRVAADPTDGDAQLELGFALLQRIRETADPSLYPPAEAALTEARRLLPDEANPVVGHGGLQLGRHEFAAAFETAQAALEIDPSSVGAANVMVDALVELGRYEEAFNAAEALVAASADLTSLARLSYTRELQGDLPGALTAMQQAAEFPGLAPENTAFVLALVGHLQRQTGDPAAARASWEQALLLVPDHAQSIAGLGRLAVGDGDFASARGYFERAAAILPLPEYVIALGETLEAAGDTAGARDQYDLARAQIALFEAGGVIVDLEFSLFEADHGDPTRALTLAETAFEAAPTIRAADALAWALHRLGREDEAWERSQEALRLGSRDPLVLFHAGAIAAARGDEAQIRELLTAALATDPGFSATGAAEARRLLEALPPSS